MENYEKVYVWCGHCNGYCDTEQHENLMDTDSFWYVLGDCIGIVLGFIIIAFKYIFMLLAILAMGLFSMLF